MSTANLLRVAEVAKRLGLSSSKIYQLVTDRKISCRRIDGAIRFEETDLAEFLESTKRGRKSADGWPKRADPRNRQKVPRGKDWF